MDEESGRELPRCAESERESGGPIEEESGREPDSERGIERGRDPLWDAPHDGRSDAAAAEHAASLSGTDSRVMPNELPSAAAGASAIARSLGAIGKAPPPALALLSAALPATPPAFAPPEEEEEEARAAAYMADTAARSGSVPDATA